MALDIQKWLTEEMGFTVDEAKDLAPRFVDRADKLDKGYLRQADYSKRMNDGQATITKTQETLAAAEAKLNAEMAEWAELTAEEKKQAGDLKAKVDASEARIFTLTQKLTRLAEDAGIDPKTVLGDGEVPPPKKKDEPNPLAGDFDKLRGSVNGFADFMLNLTAELPAIAAEHFELTGKHLDTRAFIAGIKADMATGKAAPERLDPQKRWETDFKIAEIRATKATEAAAAHDKHIRAEERAAVVSELALPGGGLKPRTDTLAPAYRTTNVTKGSVLHRPQPSQRSGAAAALASGKYRQPETKSA